MWDKCEVYKVGILRRSQNGSEHYASLLGIHGFDIKYTIGNIYYPAVGGLFGFKKLEDVKYFVDKVYGNHAYYRIMCGIGENVRYVKYMSGDYVEDGISNFWESKRKHKKYDYAVVVPKGTIIMDSFQFIEVIR